MKKNKKIILVITIILFMVAGSYFIESAESEVSNPEESEEMKKLQKEFNQLSIDYLNLQGENEELQDHINWLYEENFETYKSIYESDFANEYIGESSEIIHKEIEEDKYILLVENETGFLISVWLKGQESPLFLEFSSLSPEEGFDWGGGQVLGPWQDHNFYGGIITENEIQQVNLVQNEKIHEAEIVKIDNNLSIWYSLFDYETSIEPDQIKIEALDNDGLIVWEEEAFNGN
ncbi:hypothetical protein [Oceanobacillus luteolus]|uniref:PepSY domain-containing protein n=1 Tax=Oceanobacillus luteolus TaxID=1274358 RepID=A0ABW4HTQ7_9BACI